MGSYPSRENLTSLRALTRVGDQGLNADRCRSCATSSQLPVDMRDSYLAAGLSS